jgi:hypothetical protein
MELDRWVVVQEPDVVWVTVPQLMIPVFKIQGQVLIDPTDWDAVCGIQLLGVFSVADTVEVAISDNS